MLKTKPNTRSERLKYGLILLLCATIIFSIDFIYNLLRSNISADMSLIGWLYYIPSVVGHAACFAALTYLIFFLPCSLIFKNNKVAATTYLIVLILLQIFLYADGIVFSLYRFHFNGFIFGMIVDGGSEIFEITPWVYIKFILLALFIAIFPMLIASFIARRYYKGMSKNKITASWITLLLCLVVANLGNAVAVATKQPTIQRATLAMPYFFPLTANKLMHKLGIIDRAKVDNMSQLPSSDLQYPMNPIVSSDSIPGYNIIYLFIDSWNPSTFDSITTPNIYNFSKRAHTFENHYSSSSGTRGSVMGMFFGIPFIFGKELQISKTTPVIIDRLQGAGYKIQTFPSAMITSPPFHELVFRNVEGINLGSQGATSFDRDNHITKKYIEYIENYDGESPFFSFVFLDLPHAINLPAEYRMQFQPSWDEPNYLDLNNNTDRTPFFNLYKNCVYYTDKLVGDILCALEKKGMFENSVIVISGDHGQEFNENKRNFWGHASNYSQWQLRVPFVLYHPEIEERMTFLHMTTHYDVSPTIMDRFLGVQNPINEYSIGMDMYDSTSRYPHIVGGDNIDYGFLFDDRIVTTNYFGTMQVTDSKLNHLEINSVSGKQLQQAITKRNRFYK